MNRAPIELEWEISESGATVRFWIVYQFKRELDFKIFCRENFFSYFWVGRNGYQIHSGGHPAIGRLGDGSKVLFLRGGDHSLDLDTIFCPYNEFLEILEAVYEFNNEVVSIKSLGISLEEEFFQRVIQ